MMPVQQLLTTVDSEQPLSCQPGTMLLVSHTHIEGYLLHTALIHETIYQHTRGDQGPHHYIREHIGCGCGRTGSPGYWRSLHGG